MTKYTGIVAIEFVEVVFLTSHGRHVQSGVFKAIDCVGSQNANCESHLRCAVHCSKISTKMDVCFIQNGTFMC